MEPQSANSPETTAPANLVELAIPTPDGVHMADSMGIETYANAFDITSTSDSVKAQEARARVNTRIKTLDEARKAQARLLETAKDGLNAWWGNLIDPLKRAKTVFDQKILAYDDEQKAIAREVQRKAEETAAAARRKLQEEADERTRKAQADAEAKRKEAEAAAAAGNTEEAAKLNRQADRVEERAEARVEQLQERAASVVAPIIQSSSAKASGSSFRDNWKWRLKDISKVNKTFLMEVTNDAAINGIVKSMKGDAASVVGEGIEIYNERGLASRRA